MPGDLIAAEALCEWKCLRGVCEGNARRMSGCGEAPQMCREPHEGLGSGHWSPAVAMILLGFLCVMHPGNALQICL